MNHVLKVILLFSFITTSYAQNKDTAYVNLTNCRLVDNTYSWRGTNTYYDMTSWNSSPYTEGHLEQKSGSSWRFRLNYRLLYPNAKADKSGWDPNYQPGYPLIVMLHGGGERGNCWNSDCYCDSGSGGCDVNGVPIPGTDLRFLNNDHVLTHGGQPHLNAVNLAGTKKPDESTLDGRAFPGFVLFPQNVNSWGNSASSNSDLSHAIRIIRLLCRKLNIDQNRIYIHGLSLGGQAVYKALNMADWLFAAAAPMSALNSVGGTEYDSISNIGLWAFQGGKDTEPLPSETEAVIRKFREAGGIARYSLYPSLGHGTWNTAYSEPDFFTWLLSHNKSNLHVSYGNPNICGTTGNGAKLILAQGFYAYQWERDGQLIPDANTYFYVSTIPGVYRARFSRISSNPTEAQWNRWSNPVTISEQTPPQPQIEQVNSVILNDINNVKNATLIGPQGYEHYYWYKNGLISTLPDINTVTISGCSVAPTFPCEQTGVYSLVTEGLDKCPSLPSKNKYVVLGISNAVNPLPVITKPTGFAGSVTSPSSILLSWNDVSKNERGYEVWRRKSTDTGTQWKLASLTEEDITLFHDTGLEPNTTYYYKLRAVNHEGRSDYAPGNSNTTAGHNLIITTTNDLLNPNPPQNLTANVTGIKEITLLWEPSTDDSGIKDYFVYFGSDSILIGSTNTTFTLDETHLALNTSYNFTVRAVDLYGNLSSKSNQVIAITNVDGLYYEHSTGAWTDITTIPFTTALPEFTGTVPNISLEPRTQDDFFNFRFYGYLYINTSSASYAFQLNSNDGAELYIDDVRLIQRKPTVAEGVCSSSIKTGVQLTAGPHKIEVRYYDYTGSQCLELLYKGPDTGAGGSPPYILIPTPKLKSYDVITPPETLLTPTNFTANATSMTQINLGWQFTGIPPVGFEIYRGTSAAGPFTMVSRTTPLALSDVNLVPGTTYFYKIRTVNSNGASGFTEVIQATTLTDTEPPSQPSMVVIPGSSFTTASLIWQPSTDNVNVAGYEIWANGILLGTTSFAGYLSTNLTPFTAYTFTVIAFDANGNKSTASSPISTTTSTPDTYYSNASGLLNQPLSWGKNTDGTGEHPSFNSNGQHLIVSNRTTGSLGGKWDVEGSISKIIVPNNVTLNVDNELNGRVEVQGSGTINLNHAAVPDIISLSTQSTVNYITPSFIQSIAYGNLGLGGIGNKTFHAGVITVSGNLTSANGVALKGASNNATTMRINGDLNFNGAPSFTPPDFGIQLELTKNGMQSIATGGDLYFQGIETMGINTQVNITNTVPSATIHLGSNNGGGLLLAEGTHLDFGNNHLDLTNSATINPGNETGRIGFNNGNINITSNSNINSNLYFDPVNNQVNDFKVDLTGSGNVLIKENTSVTNAIKVKNGVLNSGGKITLVSTASKTANIQEIEGTGVISGDMTVQRYLDPKGKIYRYLSTPVEGVTVADWQTYLPITGNFTGSSTGYTDLPSMFYYTSEAWQPYPPAGGSNLAPIAKGVGYAPFLINGDLPITLQVQGNPYQDSISFNLDPDPTAANTDGWNLLGNPYASTIVWNSSAWIRSGINNTISVRNNPEGIFQYFDYVTGLGTLAGGKIAPGQSFWIQVNSSTPSLIITEKAKSIAQQTIFRVMSNPVSHLKLTLKQGSKEDYAFVAFTDIGSDSYDKDIDAVKKQNTGLFNLSSLSSNDVALAINNMSNGDCIKTIKLNIQDVAGAYLLQFDELESLSGIDSVILYDDFTHTNLIISDGYQYPFNVTTDINSYGKNRFRLRLTRPSINTLLDASAIDICEQADASIVLNNSQNGVLYYVINPTNDTIISEKIIGTGDDISLTVESKYLLPGLNTMKIMAGFKGCESKNQVLSSTINFTNTPRVSVSISEEASVCTGSAAVLSASGAPTQGYYKWYDGYGNQLSEEPSSTLITEPILEDVEYFVSAVSANGCAGPRKQIFVSVETLDVPDLVFQNDTLFTTGSGMLQWFKNGEPILNANTRSYKPETSGTYWVAKIQNGCNKQSSSYEFVIAGEESVKNSRLKLLVYPNPTKSSEFGFRVESQLNKPVEIKLTDILGTAVFLKRFEIAELVRGVRIQLQESLAHGIYFITAKQDQLIVKNKVLIVE